MDYRDYCKQYPNCKGCPEVELDYCYGVKALMKEERDIVKEKKQEKREYFKGVVEKMSPLFEEIREFNNDSFRLILPNGYSYNYYPTKDKLTSLQTYKRTYLTVWNFEKYFEFLK